jgi:hypothetical protein
MAELMQIPAQRLLIYIFNQLFAFRPKDQTKAVDGNVFYLLWIFLSMQLKYFSEYLNVVFYKTALVQEAFEVEAFT